MARCKLKYYMDVKKAGIGHDPEALEILSKSKQAMLKFNLLMKIVGKCRKLDPTFSKVAFFQDWPFTVSSILNCDLSLIHI